MDYSETKRIIRQAMFDENLVIFVGAGVSNESGIPLWREAIEEIHSKLEGTAGQKDDYFRIPQLYYDARGKKEYNELIKNIFGYDDKSPNRIHELIVDMNPCNIITTNYDDLLERAFKERGEFLKVVERDSDFPYAKNSKMILKMHGGFVHDNFVLKEDDYLYYSNHFKLMETQIKALVARHVVLFVGYSYNDPDVKQIFNWTKQVLGEDMPRAYFLDVENKFNATNVSDYKEKGINVVYAKEFLTTNPILDHKDSLANNTVAFLEYILCDEELNANGNEELDILSVLYTKLLPLDNLNYVMAKYVLAAFNEYGEAYQHYDILKIVTPKLANALTVPADIITETENTKKKRELIRKVLNKTIFTKVIHGGGHWEDGEYRTIFDFAKKDDNALFNAINKRDIVELKKCTKSIRYCSH